MVRRLLLLLMLAAPGAAGAADQPAAPSGRFAVPKATAPAPARAKSSAAPLAPLGAASAVDPGECRMGCAKRYYLCGADAHSAAGACQGAWSQCTAACNMPALAPQYSTAP